MSNFTVKARGPGVEVNLYVIELLQTNKCKNGSKSDLALLRYRASLVEKGIYSLKLKFGTVVPWTCLLKVEKWCSDLSYLTRF